MCPAAAPLGHPDEPAPRGESGGGATPDTNPSDPTPDTAPPVELPPLLLRDPLPRVIASPDELAAGVRRLRDGSGPIAVDTERASGYRYGQRAYLIQLRREGSGTLLIDPIPLPDLADLASALGDAEWILHAASQDLPCLAEIGLHPPSLFDTELAGRLLGMPRVGLAPMVASVLGMSLRKGHGAADWSTRPLPPDWLEYAALDVEVLLELRDHLEAELAQAGKSEWADQEFAAVRDAPAPAPRVEPWRRTSGLHRVKGRRALAIVAAMWHARDDVARNSDVAPGRILPDSAVVAAAMGQPRDIDALLSVPGFKGRGAVRYRRVWRDALAQAWALPEASLPETSQRGDGPPPARVWAQRDPEAAARLEVARASLHALAEEHSLPVENLLSPDLVRRLLWGPAARGVDEVSVWLGQHGARPWQVHLTAPLLAAAITPA